MVIGLTPLPDGMPIDPQANRAAIEHVTELVVIVSLMGVGLAIDRPLRLRDRESRRRWGATWRLLAIGMPLTIAAVALLGWAAGHRAGRRAPARRRARAHRPGAGLRRAGRRPADRATTRWTRPTSCGSPSPPRPGSTTAWRSRSCTPRSCSPPRARWRTGGWRGSGGTSSPRSLIGVVAGVAGRAAAGVRRLPLGAAGRCGWPSAASRCWRWPRWSRRTASARCWAATASSSVFVCALTFRSAERAHDYHAAMHEVVERLERLLTLFVLLVLGIALTRGLLDALDWRGVGDRPGPDLRDPSGRRPSSRSRSAAGPSRARDGLDRPQRWAVAFFGVRGVGSLYYLAYAAGEADVLGPGLAVVDGRLHDRRLRAGARRAVHAGPHRTPSA